VAISDFVGRSIEKAPDAIIKNAVPRSPRLWRSGNRVVLVLQRLEPEKDTITALRAWKASRLADEGWSLRIVGAGSERHKLEAWARSAQLAATSFAGWTAAVTEELAGAGILLAPAEPFGLAVLEAMAAGVPIVASAAGGHLETVGLLSNPALFPPGDAAAAGTALRSLVSPEIRAAASRASRHLVGTTFTIDRLVDQLLSEYRLACNIRAWGHS